MWGKNRRTEGQASCGMSQRHPSMLDRQGGDGAGPPKRSSPASRRRKSPPPKPATQGNPASRQPTKRTTKQRVAALKASGCSNIEIGKALQLHRDTVAKYLHEIAQAKLVLRAFRETLGECLYADLLFGMTLKYKLLTSLTPEDLTAMSLTDKRGLIRDLAISNGVTYDKLRLHEGKSTTNLAHQLQVERVHKSLRWGSAGSVSMSINPDDITTQEPISE